MVDFLSEEDIAKRENILESIENDLRNINEAISSLEGYPHYWDDNSLYEELNAAKLTYEKALGDAVAKLNTRYDKVCDRLKEDTKAKRDVGEMVNLYIDIDPITEEVEYSKTWRPLVEASSTSEEFRVHGVSFEGILSIVLNFQTPGEFDLTGLQESGIVEKYAKKALKLSRKSIKTRSPKSHLVNYPDITDLLREEVFDELVAAGLCKREEVSVENESSSEDMDKSNSY